MIAAAGDLQLGQYIGAAEPGGFLDLGEIDAGTDAAHEAQFLTPDRPLHSRDDAVVADERCVPAD